MKTKPDAKTQQKYRTEIGGEQITLMRINKALISRLRGMVNEEDIPGKKTDTKVVHKILSDFVRNFGKEAAPAQNTAQINYPDGYALFKLADVLTLDADMKKLVKHFGKASQPVEPDSWQDAAKALLRDKINELQNPCEDFSN